MGHNTNRCYRVEDPDGFALDPMDGLTSEDLVHSPFEATINGVPMGEWLAENPRPSKGE